MYRKIILFLLAGILLWGCASKRYAKKGFEFEQAGYYEKAADMYYESLLRNQNNVDAAIGMKKNGQLTLDKKLDGFMNNYKADMAKEAVTSYRDAEAYYKKIQQVGIELTFSQEYKAPYEEMKNVYLEKIYNEAYLLLQDEEFKKAEQVFNEITAIDPNYGDVDELKQKAHYEPIYRKGNEYMRQDKNRSAYFEFKKINDNLSDYKDSKELMDQALKNALFTIALVDFKNHTNQMDINKQLQSLIEKDITNKNSLFIKIIDRGSQDRITEEQMLTLEGKVDPNVSSKAGKMLGVKAFLMGDVLSYTVHKGNLARTEKRGYIKETKSVEKDGQKKEEYKYHKTKYFEFTQENKVSCRFQYKLVSAETSEVLLSNIVNMDASDQIHYARYQGDKKNLVPGYWKDMKKDLPEDVVKDNSSDNRELRRLLNASQSIKSTDVLQRELNSDIAKKATSKIVDYDPEK